VKNNKIKITSEDDEWVHYIFLSLPRTLIYKVVRSLRQANIDQ